MEAMAIKGIEHAFWAGKRVLLTGHTGFKGSWLLLWLQQLGAVVTGLALEPEPSVTPSISLFSLLGLGPTLGSRHRIGDLRDREAVRAAVNASNPDVVLHFAAQPLVSRGYSDPLDTWETNVLGTLQLLEALKPLAHSCSVVLITTDKVYVNREWEWGYKEIDRLGGHDPYSASKAAMELLVSSWRSSFCGDLSHQTPHLSIATARSGNVIGGGDWAPNRIVPDVMKALMKGQAISIRNPGATRPWQHVLEPLSGYLMLAQNLASKSGVCADTYNFGPNSEANRPVSDLVDQLLLHWPNVHEWIDCSDSTVYHEAGRLHLVSDRARMHLGWQQRWSFSTTAARTVDWYRRVHEGESALRCCLDDLQAYNFQ